MDIRVPLLNERRRRFQNMILTHGYRFVRNLFTRRPAAAPTDGERSPVVEQISLEQIQMRNLLDARRAIQDGITNRLRRAYNQGRIWEILSDGFERKVSDEHLKLVKGIVDEKRDLVKESAAFIKMGENVADYLSNALTTLTVSLYVTLTGLENLTNSPWWMKILTLALIFVAEIYLKIYCRKAFKYIWHINEDRVTLGHEELVIRMNQLRCSIECLREEDVVVIYEESAAQECKDITKHTNGDLLQFYCEEIVRPITDERMGVVQKHLRRIHWFSVLILIILGITMMWNNLDEFVTWFWNWWRSQPAAVPTASPSPYFSSYFANAATFCRDESHFS